MVAQTLSGDIELRMLLGSTFGETFRGFCTFNGLQPNVIIHHAVLHMYKDDGVAGDAGVEYLDYGETVDFEDYGLPATNDWRQLNTAGRNLYTVNLTAEVQAAYAAGAESFPFRFRVRNEEDTWASFAGWINIFPSPALELAYTMK